MAPDSRFYPYDPRALRHALMGCAAASVLLAAFALSSARGGDALAYARAAALVVLLAGFAWLSSRARPRPGWGVTVDARGITVARPLSGEDVRLPWSQVASLERDARGRISLVGGDGAQGRLVIARRLFKSAEEFEALAESLEARATRKRLDA